MSEIETKETTKAEIITDIPTTQTDGETTDKRKRTYKKPYQKRERAKEEGKMSVLGIRRVTKVGSGAKRMSFSAYVVVGDMQGRIGLGLGKSRTVTGAIEQATTRARKIQMYVKLKNGTIPYEAAGQFCKSKVLLRNAPTGTGVKAGNVVRAICTCLGIENIVTKIIGSRNFLNVAKATWDALVKINQFEYRNELRNN